LTRNKLYILLFIACLAGYFWLYLGVKGSHTVEICLIKRTTDIPCPSCGSTRSVVSITEGHFAEALRLNPLGYVIAFIMLVTPPWLLVDLLQKRDSLFSSYQKAEAVLRKPQFAIPLTVLIVINWIWNISKGL
jgi:hypothetical protein